MNKAATLILICVAGMALGTMFFGGLWWTLRKALTAPRPALWFATSLLLRMVLALVGFYFVAAGDGQRMLACLVGFVVSRAAIARLTRPRPATTIARSELSIVSRVSRVSEVRHASKS